MLTNSQGNYGSQRVAGSSPVVRSPARALLNLLGWALIVVGGFILSDLFLNTWNGRLSSFFIDPWGYAISIVCLAGGGWLLLDTRHVPTATQIQGLALWGFWAISTATSLAIVYLLLKVNYDYDLQILTRMQLMCNKITDLPGRELCTGLVGMSFYLIVTPVVMGIGAWVAYLLKKVVERHVWFNVWVRGRVVPLLSIVAFFAVAHLYFLAEATQFRDSTLVTPLYASIGIFWLSYLCTRQPMALKIMLSVGLTVLVAFIIQTTW